jgi:hypothetical protein
MAKSGAARSGPFSGFVLANSQGIMSDEMNRSAMSTQEPLQLTRMQVRVVTGIIRISHAVEGDGKGG